MTLVQKCGFVPSTSFRILNSRAQGTEEGGGHGGIDFTTRHGEHGVQELGWGMVLDFRYFGFLSYSVNSVSLWQ
jgi:hypothetical protein